MAIAKELTPEQDEKLKSLYEDFAAAAGKAGAVLREHGMGSREFAEADHRAGEIMEEINRLIGRRTWLG